MTFGETVTSTRMRLVRVGTPSLAEADGSGSEWDRTATMGYITQ